MKRDHDGCIMNARKPILPGNEQEAIVSTELFSQRKYENRPCFIYFKFPQAFRNELAALVEQASSPALAEALVHSLPPEKRAKHFGHFEPPEAGVKHYIDSAPSVYVLDLIEQFIRVYHDSWGAEQGVERTQELAAAINDLFHKYNLGFSVVGKVVMRRDSRYFDARIIRRVYSLLLAVGFEEALWAFERAIEAISGKGANYDQAVQYAEAALACTLMELLCRYRDSGKVHQMALRELLAKAETLRGFPRQALAGGWTVAQSLWDARQMISAETESKPPKPGDYSPAHACANFALNMTGAYILFLLQLNKSLILSGRLSEWDLFE